MVCTFFGHRDAPEDIRETLFQVIMGLIEKGGVSTFYFGNQGRFDVIVAGELKKIKKLYPHIDCVCVLAYLPTQRIESDYETILPDGIEFVPKKFAITYRNRWMVNQSDYVVGYAIRSIGGATKFMNYAKRIGKNVINLADN